MIQNYGSKSCMGQTDDHMLRTRPVSDWEKLVAWPFQVGEKAQQLSDIPEGIHLLGKIPRKSDAVDSLWLHQGNTRRAMQREYHGAAASCLNFQLGRERHFRGLLTTEWVDGKRRCPFVRGTDSQLARRIHVAARVEGVVCMCR